MSIGSVGKSSPSRCSINRTRLTWSSSWSSVFALGLVAVLDVADGDVGEVAPIEAPSRCRFIGGLACPTRPGQVSSWPDVPAPVAHWRQQVSKLLPLAVVPGATAQPQPNLQRDSADEGGSTLRSSGVPSGLATSMKPGSSASAIQPPPGTMQARTRLPTPESFSRSAVAIGAARTPRPSLSTCHNATSASSRADVGEATGLGSDAIVAAAAPVYGRVAAGVMTVDEEQCVTRRLSSASSKYNVHSGEGARISMNPGSSTRCIQLPTAIARRHSPCFAPRNRSAVLMGWARIRTPPSQITFQSLACGGTRVVVGAGAQGCVGV